MGMFILCKSHEHRRSARNAYTLIELLAVIFIIGFATAVFVAVRGKHGLSAAVVASVLAVVVGILLVFLFYRWTWSRDKQRLTHLREQYRNIYRVKELPTDAKNIVKPAGAEIQIGDYAWDARPNRRDGLIHLQGLTARWQVVWHAGFRQDQIEKVATKPASQYDNWAPYWAKPPPPPCPFPVRERNTPTMGLPHHSGRYFENYPSQHYQSPKDVS
jgi:prepilin-type N-terminal cleavage/methylation domain-containing protein